MLLQRNERNPVIFEDLYWLCKGADQKLLTHAYVDSCEPVTQKTYVFRHR